MISDKIVDAKSNSAGPSFAAARAFFLEEIFFDIYLDFDICYSGK